MDGQTSIPADLRTAAETYCDAVYFARAEVFEDLCHEKFQMTLIEEGEATFWNKAAYLERVRARDPFPAPAQYEILGMDESGDEIASTTVDSFGQLNLVKIRSSSFKEVAQGTEEAAAADTAPTSNTTNTNTTATS